MNRHSLIVLLALFALCGLTSASASSALASSGVAKASKAKKKGPRGRRGPQGAQGPQGPAGPAGPPGVVNPITVTGDQATVCDNRALPCGRASSSAVCPRRYAAVGGGWQVWADAATNSEPFPFEFSVLQSIGRERTWTVVIQADDEGESAQTFSFQATGTCIPVV